MIFLSLIQELAPVFFYKWINEINRVGWVAENILILGYGLLNSWALVFVISLFYID